MLEKIYPHKERAGRDSNMSLNLSKRRSRDGKAPKPKTKSQENKYFGERNRRNSSITRGRDNIPKGEIGNMKVATWR
jgi:hypothetical protein